MGRGERAIPDGDIGTAGQFRRRPDHSEDRHQGRSDRKDIIRQEQSLPASRQRREHQQQHQQED